LKKIRRLSDRSYHQADVWLVEEKGRELVYKDFSKWGRLGRFIIGREAGFYGRLRGVSGVPGFFGMPSESSILIEFIDGKSIKEFKNLDADFFKILQGLMDEFHRRGILYFDLRHKSNVIIRGGMPFIVDLGTCFYAPAFVPALSWIDNAAVLYLKQTVSPHLLTAREEKYVGKINRLSKFWFFNRIVRGD